MNDDIDLFLAHRPAITAVSTWLQRLLDDREVTNTHPAFLIVETDQRSGVASLVRLRRAVLIGAGSEDTGSDAEDACDDAAGQDGPSRFVQWAVDTSGLTLDLPDQFSRCLMAGG